MSTTTIVNLCKLFMSETDILKGKHIIPEGKSLRVFKQCSVLPFSLLKKKDKITRKKYKARRH